MKWQTLKRLLRAHPDHDPAQLQRLAALRQRIQADPDYGMALHRELMALVTKQRRLPYLCQTCGVRSVHAHAHLSDDGRACDGPVIWACDLEPAAAEGRAA